jgi:hypothetical protein
MLVCPARIPEAVNFYTSGELLSMMRFPRDLTHPHDELMRRVLRQLDLLPEDAHREALANGQFVAHVTSGSGSGMATSLLNVGISHFASNEEAVRAISASCCLTPGGVAFDDGRRYWDGGFSDPMPDDTELPTVTVSVLRGRGVDIAPGETLTVGSRRSEDEGEAKEVHIASAAAASAAAEASASAAAPTAVAKLEDIPARDVRIPLREHSRFLRYDWTGKNLRALVDAGLMSGKRARGRFEEGQRDAEEWLRGMGH